MSPVLNGGDVGQSANIASKSLKGGRTNLLGLCAFEPVLPTHQRDFCHSERHQLGMW
ncbi:hypothetical protein GCM10022419_136550 [Nonomuraea rosea]|uniref:Transposase n=1 Tax=Nonomuraea rosea TaxID=638574 RepID=A0ABP7ABP3_9ACTN